MMTNSKKMMTVTMLISLSVVFHIVESMIPVVIAVPGFRLGLANIVGICALYLYDAKTMFLVNISKVIFATLLRGTLLGTGFLLSMSGVLLSSTISVIAKKYSKMSIFGVSVIGSSFHCIGQVIMVTLIYQQYFMQSILPVLILLSIPSGLLIAYLANQVILRVKKK